MQHQKLQIHFLALFSLLSLNGCAAVGMTLFGIGAGVATGTSVSYILDGIAPQQLQSALMGGAITTSTGTTATGTPMTSPENVQGILTMHSQWVGEISQKLGYKPGPSSAA